MSGDRGLAKVVVEVGMRIVIVVAPLLFILSCSGGDKHLPGRDDDDLATDG